MIKLIGTRKYNINPVITTGHSDEKPKVPTQDIDATETQTDELTRGLVTATRRHVSMHKTDISTVKVGVLRPRPH